MGLRADVGPGLRYQTPVGPVRFDFGYQLTPIDGLVVNGEPEAPPLARAHQHRSGVLSSWRRPSGPPEMT